jgi:dienelactone hydrolase
MVVLRIFVTRSLAMLLAVVTTISTGFAETAQVPSPNGQMTTDVFLPKGKGPFPVMIFSHGRDGDPLGRARMHHALKESIAAFWTSKGIAVVAPIRPGYGPTGGSDVEDHGSCSRGPDFQRTGTEAARAIVATVDWVRQQSWAKPNKLLLVGQSVGGLGTVAAASQNPPGVVGYVNFAGGTGGDPARSPGKSCRPDLMTDLYGGYGGSTRLPGLWFYASNDLYWGPDAPKQWGQAYNAHGGRATLNFTGPSGSNGHHLFAESPGLWEGKVAAFMREREL